MTEWFAGQLPALHRFNLLPVYSQSEIILLAFLNRPIIPVAHHDSFAQGYDAFDGILATINSLGPVQWLNPEEILRRCFSTKLRDGILWVKPHSRRVKLSIPDDVYKMRVSLPVGADPSFSWEIKIQSRDGAGDRVMEPAVTPHIEVTPGDAIELRMLGPKAVDFRQVRRVGASYPALARRLVCEARDRISPLLGPLARPRSK